MNNDVAARSSRPVSPERRLSELGLALPAPFPPAGRYRHAVRTGDLLFLAGHVPIDTDGQLVVGTLGAELDVAAGRRAAHLAALSALTTLRETLGSLDHVGRVVAVRGLVNATADFTGHTAVVDAASDVLIEVFGELGEHARIAFGVVSLPADLALELELIIKVTP